MKQIPPVVVPTSDGSYTVRHQTYDATYHSIHGAVQESMHVFINAGLIPLLKRPSVRIFEFGFGTGLNLMLTAKIAEENTCAITYHSIDVSPPPLETLKSLGYPESLERPGYADLNESISGVDAHGITIGLPNMEIRLQRVTLEEVDLMGPYDLVYYDAFGPAVQPELWTVESLRIIAEVMSPEAVLVTYCAQGQFKRNLKSLGFEVESIPGPPGKREMVRAVLKSHPLS